MTNIIPECEDEPQQSNVQCPKCKESIRVTVTKSTKKNKEGGELYTHTYDISYVCQNKKLDENNIQCGIGSLALNDLRQSS